jgi:uncharacterized membrane protein HdeD (DUF308 family)
MTENDLPKTTPLTLVGIMLITLGVLAIATPAVAGKTVVMVIGIMMLMAGVIQVASGLRTDGLSNRLPPIILGTIALLCGIALLAEPWIGMAFITLLLAIFFAIEGIWKIANAFNYRPAAGWLAFLASGILSLVLGVMIWQQWPISGLWAVGILVGVNLLMTGISLVAVASTVRGLKRLAEEATGDAATDDPAAT